MTLDIGEIVEIRLEAGGISALLACPPALRPAPGQYLLGFAPELGDVLPTALFPASLPGSDMAFSAPLPPSWMAGTRLALRGPLGRGFHLPAQSRRLALAALGPSAGALLPLADQALANGGEVAFYTRSIPAGLPAQVEALPLDLLPEALAWADFLALDLNMESLSGLAGLFGLRPYQPLPCPAEALVRMPMPCAGLAECGVCAVHTRSGWKLACKEGPVFDLAGLLAV